MVIPNYKLVEIFRPHTKYFLLHIEKACRELPGLIGWFLAQIHLHTDLLSEQDNIFHPPAKLCVEAPQCTHKLQDHMDWQGAVLRGHKGHPEQQLGQRGIYNHLSQPQPKKANENWIQVAYNSLLHKALGLLGHRGKPFLYTLLCHRVRGQAILPCDKDLGWAKSSIVGLQARISFPHQGMPPLLDLLGSHQREVGMMKTGITPDDDNNAFSGVRKKSILIRYPLCHIHIINTSEKVRKGCSLKISLNLDKKLKAFAISK